MKKLICAMSCIAAIVLTTVSCSSDDIPEQNKPTNINNSENFSAKVSDTIMTTNETTESPTPPPPPPGIDDKDLPKGS